MELWALDVVGQGRQERLLRTLRRSAISPAPRVRSAEMASCLRFSGAPVRQFKVTGIRGWRGAKTGLVRQLAELSQAAAEVQAQILFVGELHALPWALV